MQHAESIKCGWTYETFSTAVPKFRGYYLELENQSVYRLHFKASGQYYVWSRVNTYISGILNGNLAVSHHGETSIVNHTSNHVCMLKFHASEGGSFFSSAEPNNKVTALIKDSSEHVRYVVNGSTAGSVEYAQVMNPQHADSFNDVKRLTLGKPVFLWKHVDPE